MKWKSRILSGLLAALLLFSLTACGGQTEEAPQENTDTVGQQEEQAESPDDTENGGNALAVYYSATGTTKGVAETIADTLGADIFEITPTEPYTSDDLDWTNDDSRVSREHEDESLRTVDLETTTVENWADYDTVFIGYPIWWGDMPMILYTFFDTYDLSGKTVIPFSTHGGSSFAGTPSTIAELEPDAEILDGLTISRSHIEDAEQEIIDWVNSLEK